jgi:RHS repeat-associated protein
VVQEVTYSLPGGALLTTRATGNVWSYPNIHGDIAATANQAGVKQGATRVYDPYGNLIAGGVPDNSAGNFDYAWLGQHQRPLETEPTLQPLIEMGARQYSPILGRSLEVDPIEGGSANDYEYVNAEPIDAFDLTGTCKKHKGFFGRIRDAGCHTGNVLTKNRVSKATGRIVGRSARLVGRCVVGFEARSTNIKIAMTPYIHAGNVLQ